MLGNVVDNAKQGCADSAEKHSVCNVGLVAANNDRQSDVDIA